MEIGPLIVTGAIASATMRLPGAAAADRALTSDVARNTARCGMRVESRRRRETATNGHGTARLHAPNQP